MHKQPDMPMDYDSLSSIYNEFRTGSLEIIEFITRTLDISSETSILDIGCGTGNHTLLLKQKSDATMIGVDVSWGMISKALAKSRSDEIEFAQALAEYLPFADSSFDLVLMIEVIHHLQDASQAIKDSFRVTRPGGRVCIVTQSHRQIEERTTSIFFPATVEIEKARYPTIVAIEKMLKKAGFSQVQSEITVFKINIDHEFLETVSRKGFSVLHLIDESEFNKGLIKLKKALAMNGEFESVLGYTFIFGMKERFVTV